MFTLQKVFEVIKSAEASTWHICICSKLTCSIRLPPLPQPLEYNQLKQLTSALTDDDILSYSIVKPHTIIVNWLHLPDSDDYKQDMINLLIKRWFAICNVHASTDLLLTERHLVKRQCTRRRTVCLSINCNMYELLKL